MYQLFTVTLVTAKALFSVSKMNLVLKETFTRTYMQIKE